MTSNLSKAGLSISVGYLILGFSNWIFWVLVARITVPNDIGLASSISSIALLVTTISLVGIEFPLLKNSSKNKSFFGSILIFEVILNLILIPIIIMSIQQVTDDSISKIIAISIIFSSVFLNISMFSILGALSIRPVLITLIIASLAKLPLVYIFLEIGLQHNGILLAIAFQFIISGIILSIIAFSKFQLNFKKEILFITLKEGLSNFAPKLSIVFQTVASITILAFFKIPNESIALFTFAIGFIIFITGIPTGISQMVVTTSTKEKTDLSHIGGRLGMAVTSPLIVILIVSSGLVLGIYGSNFSEYYLVLTILGISLIPFMITNNTIARLNNTENFKKIILLGAVESVVFLITIIVLVPIYGIIGASLSIIIALSFSGFISFKFSKKETRKIFLKSIISIGAGVIIGFSIQQFFENDYITLVSAIFTTIFVMIGLKLINFSDILIILKKK